MYCTDCVNSVFIFLNRIHCWKTVATEEGFKVLYSGIAPALLRQAVYGTIKYGLYYSLKDAIVSSQICGEESAITNVSIAVVSGAISSAVANPTDVLKVRMQSGNKIHSFSQPYDDHRLTVKEIQTNCPTDGNKSSTKADNQFTRLKMSAAFKDIYIKEGIGGLWRGVFPTAQRAALVAGVQLPVYDLTKLFFIRHDILKESPINNLASSIVAGLCACLVSSPMDVIRTRMMDQRKLKKLQSSPIHTKVTQNSQSQTVEDFSKKATVGNIVACKGKCSTPLGKGEAVIDSITHSKKNVSENRIKSQPPHIYKSTFECGYVTIRKEGISALYRGFVPAFMRMGPWNIIFFLVYEQLKQIA